MAMRRHVYIWPRLKTSAQKRRYKYKIIAIIFADNTNKKSDEDIECVQSGMSYSKFSMLAKGLGEKARSRWMNPFGCTSGTHLHV